MRAFQALNPHFEEPLMESQNPQEQLHAQTHPSSFCVQLSCCRSLTPLLPWDTQGTMPSSAQSSWMLIPAMTLELFPQEELTATLRCEKELPQKGWFSPSPSIYLFCGVYMKPLCFYTLCVLLSNTQKNLVPKELCSKCQRR